MSRIGKQPIPVPAGVRIKLDGKLLTVTGGQGTLSRDLPPRVHLEMDDKEIRVVPQDDSRLSRSFWGLTRTLVECVVYATIQKESQHS